MILRGVILVAFLLGVSGKLRIFMNKFRTKNHSFFIVNFQLREWPCCQCDAIVLQRPQRAIQHIRCAQLNHVNTGKITYTFNRVLVVNSYAHHEFYQCKQKSTVQGCPTWLILALTISLIANFIAMTVSQRQKRQSDNDFAVCTQPCGPNLYGPMLFTLDTRNGCNSLVYSAVVQSSNHFQ